VAPPPVPTTPTTVPVVVPVTTTTAAPPILPPPTQPDPCSVPAPHGEPNVDNPDGLMRNTACPVGTPAYPYVYGYNH
jgi:hypothetical protein